jgi:hypothetical protein
MRRRDFIALAAGAWPLAARGGSLGLRHPPCSTARRGPRTSSYTWQAIDAEVKQHLALNDSNSKGLS